MKTIQALYDEIMASRELKEKFIESAKAGKQEAFLKEHGCEATLEEVKAFLEAKAKEDAPLSLDEMENAAGGTCNEKTAGEAVLSIFTVSIGCTIVGIVSQATGVQYLEGNNGDKGRLCEKN